MSRTHAYASSAEPDDIARLRRDVSLSSTVSQYGFELDRNGREFETCCPFHAEDTPSFKVFIAHDGVERFHCFGCGKQGDVLDFVREAKGVDLPEAIRILGGGIGSRPSAQNGARLRPRWYFPIATLTARFSAMCCAMIYPMAARKRRWSCLSVCRTGWKHGAASSFRSRGRWLDAGTSLHAHFRNGRSILIEPEMHRIHNLHRVFHR